MKTKSAAVLTLKQPGLMTCRGRSDIVKWLRRQADYLSRHGDQYTDGRFVARYLYASRQRTRSRPDA